MQKTTKELTTIVQMPPTVFSKLGEFIHKNYGIKMPASKKVLLESRLQKRLKTLGMASYREYVEYVFSPDGEDEIIQMIDLVTTNKTDFFREPGHFEYLVNNALPDLIARRQCGLRKPLSTWSAGCSTGDEPYTLAMVLTEFAASNPGFYFNILATDVSTRVLDIARNGTYNQEKIEPIPHALRKKYLLRSKDPSKKVFRIAPEIRRFVHFNKLNFMDRDFGIKNTIDIIFCRNVIIYFNRQTQEQLLNKFARHLAPDGYLFMGHSETLTGLDVPFASVAPTVYRKTRLVDGL
ncbi:protein-glutamate O-methyltransferase [candidate division KSB1 bacterium]|nr:protein-glutamate O-methyltransferase [candidate division KSB1 bacterium]